MHPKKLTTKALISVLMVSLIGSGVLSLIQKTATQSEYFSNKSLKKLEELNEEYDIVVTGDLLNPAQSSNLMTDIMSAGITEAEETAYRGLIMTLEDSQEGILLLQPVDEVGEAMLGVMAREYEKAVPEANFEVDQEVSLTWSTVGEVVDEAVEIQEEVAGAVEVRVAVIDTGVQMDHPHFEGVEFEIVEGANVRGGNNDLGDEIGHGTHISGIIAGNTVRSVILPFKIVDLSGGKLSDVIKATDLALESDVDVINMSFGVLGGSYGLSQMMDRAEDEGVIVVAAAGNFDTDEGFYPATYDSTIAVAGTYQSGRKTQNSNYGDWIDLAALGYRVESSIPYNEYDTMNGTSQAAAFVSAAVAAVLAEEGGMSKDELMEHFTDSKQSIWQDPLVGVPLVK